MSERQWYFGGADSETYTAGPYGSREDAIAAANEYYAPNDVVETGWLNVHIPCIDVEHLLETLRDDGNVPDGVAWLENITREQQESLEAQLNAVLARWLEEIDEVPEFGYIEDAQQHIVPQHAEVQP